MCWLADEMYNEWHHAFELMKIKRNDLFFFRQCICLESFCREIEWKKTTKKKIDAHLYILLLQLRMSFVCAILGSQCSKCTYWKYWIKWNCENKRFSVSIPTQYVTAHQILNPNNNNKKQNDDRFENEGHHYKFGCVYVIMRFKPCNQQIGTRV